MWLAIWGVINSVISAYYYLRPIVLMYMTEGKNDIAVRSHRGTTIVAIVSAVVILLFGLMSGPLFNALEQGL